MEQNRDFTEDLNPLHLSYWTQPESHALIKEEYNGKHYYSIYQLEPVLMMLLCDDLEYSLKLSKKMIESGVKVFDSLMQLCNWRDSFNNK